MSELENSVSRVDHQPLVVPLNLWLQWHGDGTPEDDGEVCESEVTWCREKIFDHDVEYVHADEIRRALMGHRRSELWGDNGLIAATMRCVDAIGMIEDLVTTEKLKRERDEARKIAKNLGLNLMRLARFTCMKKSEDAMRVVINEHPEIFSENVEVTRGADQKGDLKQ